MRHGYPDITAVHDDETEPLRDQDVHRRLPSWRRLALAILKNDFLCKSLSIGQVRDVIGDVYDRVESGRPVRVRKSVVPVYDYLRSQYDAYQSGGADGVEMSLKSVAGHSLQTIKDRYRGL